MAAAPEQSGCLVDYRRPQRVGYQQAEWAGHYLEGFLVRSLLSPENRMEAQSKVLTFQERSVLDLLKAHVQSKKDAIDALQKKAQYNFTTINILGAVVAGFNIDDVATADLQAVSNLRVFLILLIGILYCLVAVLSIRALRVKKRRSFPMKPSKEIMEEWTRCTVDHHKKVLRESYLIIYEDLGKIEDGIANKVECGHTCIVVAIVLFIVQALISLPPVGTVINSMFIGN